MYDLFFIAANNTEWKNFKEKFPHARRIDPSTDVMLDCAKESYTVMFWIVESGYLIDENWDFTYTAPIWVREYIHTWQAYSKNNTELGVSPIKLIPKNIIISNNNNVNRLFENTGFIKSMQEKIVYQDFCDIFFVTFNEPNANANWQKLLKRFPNAKRIHGVVGIDRAHKECAKRATTNMFWTIDGDTVIDDTFTFDYIPDIHDRNYIHIWYSRNPVNGLEYGYGAVKLWPKSQVLSYEGSWLDYTMSVGQIKIMNQVVATTVFNSSSFETWKSSFRECVKLMRNIDLDKSDNESQERLKIWLTVKNQVAFADSCIKGANDAVIWYQNNKNNLGLINNFYWLTNTYNEMNSINR